jgi:aspartyl-tRNA synthetase
MLTGKIEVLVKEITILSISKELPFEINDTSIVKEDIRIKNRFLDIRSSRMLKNLRIRHNLL